MLVPREMRKLVSKARRAAFEGDERKELDAIQEILSVLGLDVTKSYWRIVARRNVRDGYPDSDEETIQFLANMARKHELRRLISA